MHIYFYFYVTTINIPMGFICHKIIHLGLKIYEAAKQTYIFIFFSNAMLNAEK
jgi:hypothetical protein